MEGSLVEFRDRLKLTQAELAERMGLPFRTYQDLEAGVAKLRPIHLIAADYAGLLVAVERQEKALAPKPIADLAKRFSEIGKPRRRLL